MQSASTALKSGSRVHRALSFERAAIDKDARTIQISWASEEPYQRWWGVEVLDCTAQAVRLARLMAGAPLLWNHDTDEQIGVVESVSIGADRRCRAIVRFSRSADAEEVWQDVVDGIRRNVSVGYLIHKAELVEKSGDPEEGSNQADTYRVSDWEPYELSFVSVPADFGVGVGRSAEDDPRIPVFQPATPATPPAPAAILSVETRTMQTAPEVLPVAPALNINADADNARRAERSRIAELTAIGEQFSRFGGVEGAKKAVEEGTDVQGFRNLMANAITSAQTAQVTNLDLSKPDLRRFNLMRAIRGLADRDWRSAGFEKDCSDAICKRAGIAEPVNNGIYVPLDIMQRDLTVGTPSAGGFMVATEHRPQNFIELLRARSVVVQQGATVLPGLVGNAVMPKQSGSATAFWLATEAAAITESQQTIGQLALTPKTVGAYTEISRLLMLQSTPAVDALVFNDFARVIALAIDLAALEGSGASGQPTGISNTGSIGSVTGTSMDLAKIIEFQSDLAAGNALSTGCAYVTTPSVAALLAARARITSTDSLTLWRGNILDGQVEGFKATTTTQMTAASMIFGDFSQVVIGEWGMFEIALNPYASFAAGITGIRAMQSLDVGVRQAAAFSRATSIT